MTPPYHSANLTRLRRFWIGCAYVVVAALFRLLCRVRIEGGQQIPTAGGVVLVSNHRSGFDTLLIPYSIFRLQKVQTIWAPAKAELFRLAFLRVLLTSLHAFPVRRGQGDLRAIRQMLQRMRTNKMMLFPEGTRSPDGTLQPGNRTVGKLLYQTRPVVIPTAIVGTEQILAARHRLWPWRVPVVIRYGTPIDLQQYYTWPDTKETAEAILKEVMGAIATLLYNPSQTPYTHSRPAEHLSQGTPDVPPTT